jgi:hypothetical protein
MSRHNLSSFYFPELPDDFLGLDQARVDRAAELRYNRDDLLGATEQYSVVTSSVLEQGVRNRVVDCDPQDDLQMRFINRGASLGHLLIAEGASLDRGASYLRNQIHMGSSSANPRQIILEWALDSFCVTSQRGRSIPDIEQSAAILDKARLTEPFEHAVSNLVGFPQPTPLPEAMYGGALIALGVGITESARQ